MWSEVGEAEETAEELFAAGAGGRELEVLGLEQGWQGKGHFSDSVLFQEIGKEEEGLHWPARVLLSETSQSQIDIRVISVVGQDIQQQQTHLQTDIGGYSLFTTPLTSNTFTSNPFTISNTKWIQH